MKGEGKQLPSPFCFYGAMEEVVVIWFKRDLRLGDHLPLVHAANTALPVVAVCLDEPAWHADSHFSSRHYRFFLQAVNSLHAELQQAGHPGISFFKGPAEEAFEQLMHRYRVSAVYSHQETGLRWSYQRDLALQNWFKSREIPWYEEPNNGVLRGLRNRQGWKEHWYSTMRKGVLSPPENLHGFLVQEGNFSAPPIAPPPSAEGEQVGTHKLADRYLETFISARGREYNRYISKPAEAREHCSRLSPYLAWGMLSVRQVYQACMQAGKQPGWKRAMQGITSRLRWHCHFIQKFEMEDRMEFEPVNRAYATLDKASEPRVLKAWQDGRTGFPLVDACMRCLTQTGYLNFRMRAMLVSVATHHLELNWRDVALHLGRLFIDFEPGIHFPQVQMQAGLTGTNTVRIYNPLKQAQEHDPTGAFIYRWVPELRTIPPPLVFEPHTLNLFEQSEYNFRPGVDYPLPLCDLATARKAAADRIYSVRRTPKGKSESQRIVATHTLPNRNPYAS